METTALPCVVCDGRTVLLIDIDGVETIDANPFEILTHLSRALRTPLHLDYPSRSWASALFRARLPQATGEERLALNERLARIAAAGWFLRSGASKHEPDESESQP